MREGRKRGHLPWSVGVVVHVAVSSLGQGDVFVVDANGVVHSRPIKVAFEKQGIYVISSGLSTSERFIFDGVQKVNDGDHITSRFKAPGEALQSIKLKAS